MSLHIGAIAWKVKFPSQTQKLLILRMADFSHENGTGIFPAIDTMATDIGCSRRQIQYALKALEGCELIVRERQGGKGHGHTNIWRINLDLLVSLATQKNLLKGAHDRLEIVENEGATIAPLDLLRVQSAASRVQSATLKGEAHCTQTLNNPYIEPLDARERARDEPRASRARKEPAPIRMFELTPRDITWKAWLAEMEKVGRTDLADQAIDTGKIQVTSKWPDKGIQGLVGAKQKKTADITARITGDRSEGE